MASLLGETAQKVFTPETLRAAAKQSERCHVVPVPLRRAIKKYLREQEEPHMRRNVLRLSESFSKIKGVNLMLAESTSRELVEDPLKSVEQSKRWKIRSAYGDIGLKYTDDETVAYVASRMPAVYSALYRVLSEVRRRIPDLSPARVLDFGAGTGSAMWALNEVWPKQLERIHVVEPSQAMQRAGKSLIRDLKDLPFIRSYNSIQALSQSVGKSERKHDLVIASYVLGEIPSLKDRVTVVRQLWDLTQDVLVLVEPGTPHGSNIISQMRSHILWMEKRKCRKSQKKLNETSKELVDVRNGAYVVAPCPHDGKCPLEKSGKYCHFVQRLQRTTSQLAYKRSKGQPLRGFEDEKFSFVVFRRGQRPRGPWASEGMKFNTLKDQKAEINSEDHEIDDENLIKLELEDNTYEEDPVSYDSDATETDVTDESSEEEGDGEEVARAEVNGGWGRILFMPVRRGRLVEMDVCQSTKHDGSEGSFDHIVVTKSKNPTLHHQARRSLWGDLWPSGIVSCRTKRDSAIRSTEAEDLDSQGDSE